MQQAKNLSLLQCMVARPARNCHLPDTWRMSANCPLPDTRSATCRIQRRWPETRRMSDNCHLPDTRRMSDNCHLPDTRRMSEFDHFASDRRSKQRRTGSLKSEPPLKTCKQASRCKQVKGHVVVVVACDVVGLYFIDSCMEDGKTACVAFSNAGIVMRGEYNNICKAAARLSTVNLRQAACGNVYQRNKKAAREKHTHTQGDLHKHAGIIIFSALPLLCQLILLLCFEPKASLTVSMKSSRLTTLFMSEFSSSSRTCGSKVRRSAARDKPHLIGADCTCETRATQTTWHQGSLLQGSVASGLHTKSSPPVMALSHNPRLSRHQTPAPRQSKDLTTKVNSNTP